jgi:hypothetical protein
VTGERAAHGLDVEIEIGRGRAIDTAVCADWTETDAHWLSLLEAWPELPWQMAPAIFELERPGTTDLDLAAAAEAEAIQ